nr:uncharacterized protein LOC118087965 [Zootoca vivipara]
MKTEMPKEPSSPKRKFGAAAWGLVVVTLVVLLFTFLVLYVQLRAECKPQPWNHTSSAESRMTESDEFRSQLAAVNQSLANTTKHWASCQEELKHSRENTSVLEDKVQKKEEALKRLDAVHQSLANTTKHWASCQEELKHSRENTSVLEDNVQKKEEALKRLDGEKNRLQDQLKSTQEKFKREREEKDKTIQHLKDQLNTRQTSSGAVLFGGPISSSLLLIVPGLLCSLL